MRSLMGSVRSMAGKKLVVMKVRFTNKMILEYAFIMLAS